MPEGEKADPSDRGRSHYTAPGDQKLFWDENNWQPLCKNCHDRKTGQGMRERERWE